jgi:hypothetical protein
VGAIPPGAFLRTQQEFLAMIAGLFDRGLRAPPSIPSATSGPPVPVPASKSAIFMPADQYLHRGAPTE